MDRVFLMRKVHAMARDLFGTAEIDGAPAYVRFLKDIILQMFRKNSRAQLTDEEWLLLCSELEKYMRLKRGRSSPEIGVEVNDEPSEDAEDAYSGATY